MRRLLIASLVVTGCGDNMAKPDAPRHIDGEMADTPTDAPACDYTEQHDTTNDYTAASGFMTEQTMIGFTTQTKTICGTMNNGHFTSSNFAIDIDDYTFTVAQDADVLFTLTGAFDTLPASSNVGIFAVNTSTTAAAGQGYFLGNHGVFSSHLVAGTYEISVEAYADADATAPIPYKLKIATDNPATRCPKVTATANYTEANDTVANIGNDVISINYANTNPYALTTATTDAPEPTALTVAAGMNYRISGGYGTHAQDDDYFDKDTYAFATGPMTNQVSIRLNWPSTNADLDYFVFPAGTVNILQNTDNVSQMEPEFKTFAVKPNSNYWLWIGAYKTTTDTSTYDASICAEQFTP